MNSALVTDDYVVDTAYRRWHINLVRHGYEWHGPCPTAGCSSNDDGFWVNRYGHFQCRNCSIEGWLDDDQPNRAIDPLELLRRAEDKKRERERRHQRWVDWTNGFLAGKYWREWHDRMSAKNRAWWHAKGINDKQIDYYELGYIRRKTVQTKSGLITLPAYTIPVRDPLTWDITNIHYRLVDPPPGVQKYRYEHDIPSREFYAMRGACSDALVIEGAIKAMVMYRFLRGKIQVIGLPSKDPGEEIMERVAKFKRIWLALDPDANEGCRPAVVKFCEYAPHAKVILLDGKPDDLVLAGMTLDQWRAKVRSSVAGNIHFSNAVK